jgi:protein SCO1
MKPNARVFFRFVLILSGISLSSGLMGCSSPKPAQQENGPTPSRYSLNGRVVSVDKAKQEVTVDAGDIPGFMSAMTMPYAVKNPNLLEPLTPEDQITADVMVNGSDVWLENIVVVKKPDQAEKPAPSNTKPASAPPSKH